MVDFAVTAPNMSFYINHLKKMYDVFHSCWLTQEHRTAIIKHRLSFTENLGKLIEL